MNPGILTFSIKQKSHFKDVFLLGVMSASLFSAMHLSCLLTLLG